MPMETSAATQTGGIRPIERPSGSQPSSRTVAVRSPFAPETNVSIRNSISDMAGILLRITGEAEDVAEGMTPDVQRLVNNVMKNSFSLEETLGKSLGSTVESQRFAMDQLNTLSRLLTQMGNLARQTSFGEMSQPLATILSQLKTVVTQENSNLEPVLLHKLSYELLDRKEPDVIPPELMELLSQQPVISGGEVPLADDSSLGFLKQLVAYFMPATPREEAQLHGEAAMPDQMAKYGQQTEDSEGAVFGKQTAASDGRGTQQSLRTGEQNTASQANMFSGAKDNSLSGQRREMTGFPSTQSADVPADGKLSEGKLPEGRNHDGNTGQGRFGGREAQPAAVPADGKLFDGKLPEGRNPEGNPVQGRFGGKEAQPADVPADGKPSEGKLSEGKQSEGNPAQGRFGGGATQSAGIPADGKLFDGKLPEGRNPEGNPAQGRFGGREAQPADLSADGKLSKGNFLEGRHSEGNKAHGRFGSGEAQPELKTFDRSQQMLNNLGRPFRPTANTGLQNLNAGRMAKSFDGVLRDITGRPIEANENPAARLARLSAESMAERRSNSPAANRPSSALNSHVFFRQPAIENSARTMVAMKGLAQLLTKDAALSESDRQLLLNFVNGDEEIISEKDARQMNLLLRLCQKNLPASVQQAAIQQNLPGLPRMWAFLQLCDLATLKETKSRRLRNAGRDIAEFAGTVKESMVGTARMTQSGQRTMSFMLPLYMGEEAQSYPCYVSVFDEEKYPENEFGEEDKTREKQRETWLRFCVLTENIGAVEITCRLYEENKVDVRVFFSSSAAVGEFRDYVPEFVHSFDESPLELVGLKLGVAKAK